MIENLALRLLPKETGNPPSQAWRTFLDNHLGSLASVDFFAGPTATFRVLLVFFVLRHDRRRVVHLNIIEFPSAAWTAQQIMTARHFIEAGYLDQILSAIKAGDYLLVQFGTNDGNKTATYTLPGSSTAIPYYLDPHTEFKTYLGKYVDATRAKGATTIFVTPPPRHTCDSGEMGVRNGLSAYATAMNELGPTLDTPVVDLNAMTMAYLANVTCETSGKTFYMVKADGSIDGTHFQENGANVMAALVAKGTTGISTLGLPLSVYVK
ncbi:MAG: hypothetical protein JXP73_01065 [Deltaproteobacteria bacterium]|nr:hypothetical protein [Deltaproteobacteria bacterium]